MKRWCLVAVLLIITSMAMPGTTAAEGEEIRIGGNLELSGGVASFGQSALRGARIAFDEVNRAGGINGRMINFIVMDNKSDQHEAYMAAERLITQERVSAILGCVTSSDSIAVSHKTEQLGIPQVSPTATNPKVTYINGRVKQFVFRACIEDPYQGPVMAKFAAARLKAKTAALVIDNSSEYSKTLADRFEQEFTSSGGVIVARVWYLQKDRDFYKLLTTVKNAGPDVVYIPGYYQEVGLIVAQARELDIQAPLLGGDGWDSPRLFSIAGPLALNGTYFTNHYYPGEVTARNKRFSQAFAELHGHRPDALAALGYEAALMIIEALRRAGSDDPGRIRDALEGITVDGLMGSFRVDNLHNPIKPTVIIKLVDGEQVLHQVIGP